MLLSRRIPEPVGHRLLCCSDYVGERNGIIARSLPFWEGIIWTHATPPGVCALIRHLCIWLPSLKAVMFFAFKPTPPGRWA